MPRTKTQLRSQFRTGLPSALKNVRKSIAAFSSDSGKAIADLVISSNVTLGDDRPRDIGVAVWFTWDGLSVCIAVDRYPNVESNLQAIHLILEARRTELRHGGLNIVRATFTGFQALPAPAQRSWRDVFGFNSEEADRINRAMIDGRYRLLAAERHPDRASGSHELMAELNRARAEALAEVGA
nr:J domain-containing protein [Mycoplana azooxidifex]